MKVAATRLMCWKSRVMITWWDMGGLPVGYWMIGREHVAGRPGNQCVFVETVRLAAKNRSSR